MKFGVWGLWGFSGLREGMLGFRGQGSPKGELADVCQFPFGSLNFWTTMRSLADITDYPIFL